MQFLNPLHPQSQVQISFQSCFLCSSSAFCKIELLFLLSDNNYFLIEVNDTFEFV
jgi:hypothetical protein